MPQPAPTRPSTSHSLFGPSQLALGLALLPTANAMPTARSAHSVSNEAFPIAQSSRLRTKTTKAAALSLPCPTGIYLFKAFQSDSGTVGRRAFSVSPSKRTQPSLLRPVSSNVPVRLSQSPSPPGTARWSLLWVLTLLIVSPDPAEPKNTQLLPSFVWEMKELFSYLPQFCISRFFPR